MIPRKTTLLFATILGLAACDERAGQRLAEVEALRDSMARLNALEDRTFAAVGREPISGLLVPVVPVQDLQVLTREAREAAMVGCAGQARDALVATIEQIIRGGAEAEQKVERYRNAAEACDALLEAQANRWPGGRG